MTDQPEEQKRVKAIEEVGITQKTKRSREELKKMMVELDKQIDAFMINVGYQKPEERTDEKGWRYFSLGSANGRAGSVVLDDNVFLRVESPVFDLPSDKELILPLVRELLELNYTMPGVAKLCIAESRIYCVATYPTQMLSEEEVGSCIHNVMNTSDHIDDGIKEKYSGTTKSRS